MPFCSSCGTENKAAVKFCSECGKPVSVAPAAEAETDLVASAPKKSLLKNKLFLFGGGGFLALVLLVVGVVALTPFSLDAKSAEARLMTADDFAFSAVDAKEPNSVMEGNYPLFRASDKCTEDVDLQTMINDEGVLLASADFSQDTSDTTMVHFDEDIIQFPDAETANRAVELARLGYADSNCEYNSIGEYENVSTIGKFSDGGDLQSALGVGGTNSFYLRYESNMIVTGAYTFNINQDQRIAVIARGPYVVIIRGVVDAEDKGVSTTEMEDSIRTAVRKIFG